MSNHKTPLTEIEREGLIAHGLGRYIGKPSQLMTTITTEGDTMTAQEHISKVARMLANQQADACGVDREDNWRLYGEEFIADTAEAMSSVLAHIDQQQAEIERLRSESEERLQNCAALLAEVERLRAAPATAPAQPAWHDAPTVPGLWVSDFSWMAQKLGRETVEFYAKNRSIPSRRWYGPIPEDRQ